MKPSAFQSSFSQDKLEDAVVQTILWSIGITGTLISLGVFTAINRQADPYATHCPTPVSLSSVCFFVFLTLTIVEFFYAYKSLCLVQSFSAVRALVSGSNDGNDRKSFLIWHFACFVITGAATAVSAYLNGMVRRARCADVALLSDISFLVFFAMSIMEILALYGALKPHSYQVFTNEEKQKPISIISV